MKEEYIPVLQSKIPLFGKGLQKTEFDFTSNHIESRANRTRISPQHGRVLLKLLISPERLISYKNLVEAIKPTLLNYVSTDDAVQRIYAGNIIRPILTNIRKLVHAVEPNFSIGIETIRGAGIVYHPHKTVCSYYKQPSHPKVKK